MDVAKFYRSPAWARKREHILRRDGYQCQECRRYGRTTAGTVVHHLTQITDAWPLRLADSNLLTLCARCHDASHDRSGEALSASGEAMRERLLGRRRVPGCTDSPPTQAH